MVTSHIWRFAANALLGAPALRCSLRRDQEHCAQGALRALRRTIGGSGGYPLKFETVRPGTPNLAELRSMLVRSPSGMRPCPSSKYKLR